MFITPWKWPNNSAAEKMPQTNIYPFPDYVLRNPAFPIHTYLDLLENYSEEKLLECYQKDYIKEAISIASPDLKVGLDTWLLDPEQHSAEKKEALGAALLKYIARISSRCTPFGIFAGCDVGTISAESAIVLQPQEKFTRLTQFDMHFWVAMLQDFSKRREVMPHLLFYPNNSIYSQGDFYRYIEYKYVGTKREHTISAVAKTELLAQLLHESQNGITISQMTALLADDESEEEEALEYIHQLIDFQLLVSELDAQVTGSKEWERVLHILNKIPPLQKELKLLLQCKYQFDLLDHRIIPDEKEYLEIKKLIAEMGVPFEDKFLFQTDLNITTHSNSLSKKVVEKTKQALYFLNGIRKKQSSPNLVNFAKAYHNRYETREMPLTTVLDTETGIGYIQNLAINDSHPLLDSFSFKQNNNEPDPESWTAKDFLLEKKLQQAIVEDKLEIVLTEKDFPDFDSDWENCPATFSVMIAVRKKDGTEQVVIESGGNSSAAKLLGRFCNVNQQIHEHTKAIVKKEADYFKDKILAEIVHIPESRTGNILKRPVLRDYEIPYLSNSGVPPESQIPVSDLLVSIKNNTVVLRSKRFGKEVIPYLSNAHNFSQRSLPIYHFLCDLQAQNLKPVFGFNWGILESHYSFFPRVIYKDSILSKARWLVQNTEITPLEKLSGTALTVAFAIWQQQKKLPRFVNLVNGDNLLLLDLELGVGIELFLKSFRKYAKIILEEFIFDEDTLVKNANGAGYTNQIILSFFKE